MDSNDTAQPTPDQPAYHSLSGEPSFEQPAQHMAGDAELRLRQLEDELRATNERCEAAIEEHRTANQALQAINQQLQAANAELLQANQEYRRTIEKVSQGHNDLQNLLAATPIGTLFVDSSLCVTRYTPAALAIFDLLPEDLHRPLAQIAHRLDDHELIQDTQSVLDTLNPVEREVSSNDGHVYLARFQPYRTHADQIGGVVLKFVDITDRKRAEEALRKSEARQSFLLQLGDALRVLDDPVEIEGVVTRMLGQHLGAAWSYYCTADAGTGVVVVKQNYAASGLQSLVGKYRLEDFQITSDRTTFVTTDVANDARLRPLFRDQVLAIGICAFVIAPLMKNDKLSAFFAVSHDSARAWTADEVALIEEVAKRTWDGVERARAEEALRESEERLRAVYDGTYEYIGLLRPDGTILDANRAALEFGGDAREDIVGRPFWETTWWIHTPGAAEKLRDAVRRAADGEFIRYEVALRRPSGESITFDFSMHPVRDENGKVVFIIPEGRNINDRKRAEEALRESEEHLRLATEAAHMYSWEFDVPSATYRFSPNAAGILGVAPEALPRTIHDTAALVHPDDRALIEHTLQQALDSGEDFAVDIRSIKQSGQHAGETVWLSVQSTIIRDAGGQPTRIIGIAQDTSARKRSEEALRASEERFRAIVGQATAGVSEMDTTGRFTLVNQRFCELTGYSEAALLGMPMQEIVYPDDLELCVSLFERAVHSGVPFAHEKRYMRGDGSHVWVNDSVSVIFDAQGKTQSVIAVVIDITERKQAEAALQRANEELEERVRKRTAELTRLSALRQDLLQRLVTAQEDERRRIARELHDQIGQQITSILIQLKLLQQEAPQDGSLTARLQTITDLSQELATESHQLAVDLRPTALDDVGLVGALTNYTEQWTKRTQIRLELHIEGLEKRRLPPAIELAVYRVMQEALTNVAKHAQAQRVAIILLVRGGEVQLIVEDNGQGYTSQAPVSASRLGIMNMQERVEQVGGSFSIETSPGAGTTVYVRVPL